MTRFFSTRHLISLPDTSFLPQTPHFSTRHLISLPDTTFIKKCRQKSRFLARNRHDELRSSRYGRFFPKFVPVRNFTTKVDFSGEKREFLMKYITGNRAKIVISGVYQGYIPLSLIPKGGPYGTFLGSFFFLGGGERMAVRRNREVARRTGKMDI